MGCLPSGKKYGWTTCRKCGDIFPTAAASGNLYCPHCAHGKVFGLRTCAKCGSRCPASECHGIGGVTKCQQCAGRNSKKRAHLSAVAAGHAR
eukprot:243904-Prorocentrum_lima.AAC.1